jgi:hypothetical protein
MTKHLAEHVALYAVGLAIVVAGMATYLIFATASARFANVASALTVVRLLLLSLRIESNAPKDNAGGVVDTRHTLASASSCGLLFWISLDRRRDRDADASSQTVHLNPVLVIISLVFCFWVVEYSGRNSLYAHVGDYENHLRPT